MIIRKNLLFLRGVLVVASAMATLVCGSAGGLAHEGTADEQAACTPDVFRLCFWEIPDEKRIVACLNRKAADLSPACHKVIVGDAKDGGHRKRN